MRGDGVVCDVGVGALMGTYARETTVSPDRSRAEIEKILTRYGANGFMYGWSESGAILAFSLNGKQYKVILVMPDKNSFFTNKAGHRVAALQAERSFQQATRQRWRAMALVIKAKLEAVQSQISTVESEFLAWMVLPNGETVGSWMMPQIDTIYKANKMPPLLPRGVVEGEVV